MTIFTHLSPPFITSDVAFASSAFTPPPELKYILYMNSQIYPVITHITLYYYIALQIDSYSLTCACIHLYIYMWKDFLQLSVVTFGTIRILRRTSRLVFINHNVNIRVRVNTCCWIRRSRPRASYTVCAWACAISSLSCACTLSHTWKVVNHSSS